MDMVVLGGSVGFFFGRIANFINGELYGREAPAGLSWAVKFPQEMNLWLQKDFGKLSSLGPAFDALKEFKTETGEMISVNAQAWQAWLEGYMHHDMTLTQHVHEGIQALIAATQQHNQAVIAALGQALTARYPSQLIQCVLEGLLVFLILCWIWRKPQKPGVIGGWFGVLYCTARIIGEQFRMPDVQIGFQLWGLTRGQWLSIGLLAVAIIWLIVCYRRPVAKIGGWRPAAVSN
jgi:phosphatidylglycerol:prolipoprotein diacylglycerol transferase